jgi:DUF4097 and DUF4098 domain-containing protein YvlB
MMQEEKKRILQMVQDGKITADEALSILEELEKAGEESKVKEQVLKNELSTVVANPDSGEKSYDSFNKKMQSSKEKIFDFVESAFKKIKDSDLDFNFGKSAEISHIFQQGNAYFKEAEIDIANGKTSIIPWNQQNVRIECQAKVYKTENQEEARDAFLQGVHFTIENEKLTFLVQQKGIKVDAVLYIPSAEYEKIVIRMFNGAISGEGLSAETFKAKTANGPITIGQLNGSLCQLETGNGAIALTDSRVVNAEAESLHGGIHAEGYFKKMDIQSFNGQVSCLMKDTECESIHAKTVTGKIQVSLPAGQPVDGELKSNLGGFNVSLEGIQVVEEKSDVIQKVLKFKTTKTEGPALYIFADTKTGTISVS